MSDDDILDDDPILYDDDESPVLVDGQPRTLSEGPWPKLNPAALYGLAGEVVGTLVRTPRLTRLAYWRASWRSSVLSSDRAHMQRSRG